MPSWLSAKRTTGTKAQKYAITGPGWSGTLPAGITEYKSPTGMVWILGRIYCTGTPDDYKAVHAFQDQVSAVPLSAYGKPYTPAAGTVDPGIDMKTAPRDQVNAMDAAAFFKLFAHLLKTNPPSAEDAPMVAKLAKIGIVPGQDFDASKLDAAVAKGMSAAPKHGQEKISNLPEAIATGDAKVEAAVAEGGRELGGDEPLADWERELLVRQGAEAEAATAPAETPSAAPVLAETTGATETAGATE